LLLTIQVKMPSLADKTGFVLTDIRQFAAVSGGGSVKRNRHGHMLCFAEDCVTTASYGIPGKKPTHCSKHAGEGMEDIVNKRCIEPGCSTHPSYGIPGKKPSHCKSHAGEGMEDIVNKRCIEPGCSTQPSYGIPGKKPTHCKSHAGEGMEDIVNKRCVEPGCSTQPSYGIPGKKPSHCKSHATDGMIDVVSRRCINDWCGTIVHNNKYRGYCVRCFQHAFPDEPVSRNYRIKEGAWVDAILERFPDKTWRFNKQVVGGCSKYRPDAVCDMGSHVVAAECDEHQHETDDPSCINRRTMSLMRDHGMRPIVFIRFNPDKYIDSHGNKHTSCWGLDKNGLCRVKKNKKEEWEHRLSVFLDVLGKSMDTVPGKELTEIKLFYDGY
jgi:hypothetical protein